MTQPEILDEMLTGVPDEYDTSEGSFFYDLLYPVSERIFELQQSITVLMDNAFALTAKGEYLDRNTAIYALSLQIGSKKIGQ